MIKNHYLRLLIGCIVCAVSIPAAIAADPSGRWEGRIEVPGSPIEIVVQLGSDGDGSWIGVIDIPSQGLSDFPLGEIRVEMTSVSFAMPGVPGDPVFRGTLTEDGSVLAGEFTQGATMPFRLALAGPATIEAPPEAPAVPKEIAAALAGRWEGKLDLPGQTLRLALVFATDADGRLTATFDSPDQNQTGLPVSRVTVDGRTVRAELSYAQAAFEGNLDPGGSELAGEWQQGGGAMPLILRKAERAGIPAQALRLLSAHVQGLVDDEELVGGELTVIKNRKVVLREAFGWKDREAGQPLEIGAVYCVRSMTKPLVGTAIQLLIDEGRLALDTPVREILPFFDGPQTGKITVEHLLTHTGGFPFTTLGKPLTEYADLAAVAAEAAATELLFEPGSRFEYSDAGSDTLGAIVEQITGAPVERFIQERILDPLGMEDTFVLIGDDEAVLARIPTAYSGGTGSWIEHWKPTDTPMFPIFLTSQSLYSTTTDYARFLTLWMDDGRIGEGRVLSAEAVERALTPRNEMEEYRSGFEGLDAYYGQQWIVYGKPAEDGAVEEVAFGHNGSDGTHAWVWPEEDLIVLFFTQSRGTFAGLGLEPVLSRLLIEQNLDDDALPATAPRTEEMKRVAGMYWDETNEVAYYIVIPRGNRLIVERPGRVHLVFKRGDAPGRYVHELRSDVWIEFLRSEDGSYDTMKTSFGGEVEHAPRHVPQEGLPSVVEVVEGIRQAHQLDRLPEVGPVRLSGTLTLQTRKMEGSLSIVFDETRQRNELHFPGAEQLVVMNEGRVWSHGTTTGTEELEGKLREQAWLDRPAVSFGDWTEYYEHVEVLKRIKHEDRSLLLVRVVPTEGPGATMIVDETSGRLVLSLGLSTLPGVGIVGVETRYGDFRDVGGMLLPFRSVSEFASPLIGRVLVEADNVEIGVAVSAETFAPPAPKAALKSLQPR